MPGSCASGLSHCRVAAFGLVGLLALAHFFITISHCAWRRVISWSLATKKRSKESAFKTRARKLTQRAVFAFLAPQKHGARQNHGCVKPSFSRILTRTRFAPYALGQARLPRNLQRLTRFLRLHFLLVGCVVSAAIFLERSPLPEFLTGGLRAVRGCRRGLHQGRMYFDASFLVGVSNWFERYFCRL